MNAPPVFPLSSRILWALCIVLLASGALGFFMLERDHGWGDDFAAYITQARALSTGHIEEFIQQSTFTFQASNFQFVGPITVPWGFPLLLAPAIAVFGSKILVLKFVLTLCYLAFLVTFFFLACTRLTRVEALTLTAAFAFNRTLLGAQNEVLSDIPFLLFSTLSLLLIELLRMSSAPSRRVPLLPILIGLAIFAAAFTRYNGFFLVLPLALAQFVRGRQHRGIGADGWRRVLEASIPYIVLAFLYALQARLLPSPGSALEAKVGDSIAGGLHASGIFNSLDTIAGNLEYYFWLPGEIMQNTVFEGSAVYLVLLAFCTLNFLRRRTDDLPLLLYGLATFVFYVVAGGLQGIRYLHPVLPILALFGYAGMRRAASWAARRFQPVAMALIYAFWCALVVSSVVSSSSLASQNMAAGRMKPNAWGAYSPWSAKMFDWVRHHTPPDSAIVFFKPRAMRLLGNRNAFLALACEHLVRGDYLVSVKDNGGYNQIPPEELDSCGAVVSLTPVYDKDVFVIYLIAPAP